MEYILAIILSAFATYVYLYLKKNSGKEAILKKEIKSKQELIEDYKKELLFILDKYKANKELQLKEKFIFLKRVNSELSMNIFFEKEEIKDFINELARLENDKK